MRAKTTFVLNAIIAIGYAFAFFVGASPVLAVYGIAPSPEAVFMARWFGVGLLGIGLTTWYTRNEAATDSGRSIAVALAVTYAVGVVLALWGTLTGPFNELGWIAVGFNTFLGLAMGRVSFTARKTT